ncbi:MULTISPECIES: nitrogenase component 1 [unclassified Clostridium]|uniref:nitrogenase component 1 n=1 Tax=unclassified Clostridium TaxID=2614128 RepID=UPI00029761B2|nr:MULTISPECIES: nitrogenase component 1 [unclassified Clostridium]EKQ58125.1 MAG: nitrogenase molybdenum-iron protein, alpha and beta chain [Clostridium sp. Maddingley MBC34-26]
MKNYVENPRSLCALNGALGVFSALGKTIPILHAGPGCGLQATIGVKSGYVGGGTGCPSSNMFEKEVVFGGINRLRETIEGTLEVMEGDLYAVLTGCTSGIIGDDVENLVDEFKRKDIPIAYIETSGFKGDSYFGYEVSLTEIVKQFVTKSTEKDDKTVNIFGIVPTQDITWKGNIEEITRILKKLGLKVNTFFTENQGINNIKASSKASLNIVFSPWLLKELSQIYKDEFNIDTFRYEGLPIGPTATSDFIRRLAKHISIDKELVESVIKEEEDYVFSYYEYINAMIKTYRFVVVGDANVVLGLNRFLVNDYGQIPLISIITDDVSSEDRKVIENELNNLEFARKPKIIFENDKWKISEIIRAEQDEATLILGSSFEKEIGIELGIETVTVSNPSTESLILNKGYAGYRGCLTFLEDLYDNN